MASSASPLTLRTRLASSRRGRAVSRPAGRIVNVLATTSSSSDSEDYELPDGAFQPELDFSKPWKMSDLVLSVEERKLHVHRAILAISSPVFEAMLSSNFKEKNAKEIPLSGKNVEQIEELLRAIYPYCKHAITRVNCCSLLELSCEYQMDELKQRCERFVLDTYNPNMTTSTRSCIAESKYKEVLQFVLMAQRHQLRDEVVQRCISLFVSQPSSWKSLKANEFFCQLESQYRQRVTEERVKFLENRLDTCTCKARLSPSSDVDPFVSRLSTFLMTKPKRRTFIEDDITPRGTRI